MPTLPPMPDRNPPDVLEHTDVRWWVARTRPRQEKKLARWLAARQTPYFLPMRDKRRTWRNRRIASQEPLLAGYLFFAGDAVAARTVFDSGSVTGRLEVADQLRLLEELRRIDLLLRHRQGLMEAAGLVAGREVKISTGPCAGLRGVIARSDESAQLIVRLELLGRFLQVPVDPAEVEPV